MLFSNYKKKFKKVNRKNKDNWILMSIACPFRKNDNLLALRITVNKGNDEGDTSKIMYKTHNSSFQNDLKVMRNQ